MNKGDIQINVKKVIDDLRTEYNQINKKIDEQQIAINELVIQRSRIEGSMNILIKLTTEQNTKE